MSSTSPTASPSEDSSDSSPPPPDSTSPPPPPSSTSPPPPSSTQPPPSKPASSPPPPSNPSPPPPTSSPPPAPPTSSPPPPSSTPPPATPDASGSPPPPASSSSSTPPPSPPTATPSTPTTTPSTPTVTPSIPTPVDAAPVQDSSPATPDLTPPQEKEKPINADTPRTPSHSPGPPLSGPDSGSTGSSENSGDQPAIDAGVIAGIVVGGVVIVALLMIIVCLICNKKKRKRQPQYYPAPGTNQFYNQEQAQAQWHTSPNHGGNGGGGWGSMHTGHANTSGEFSSQPMGGLLQFSYEELASATGGFCEANLLGQGGFGFVHKGVLPDRREVAVKSLKSGSGQGEREFQAEVEIISRVHHRHLVSLVGYCIANNNKLLVYEYVPNNTMEFHLHGKGQPVLDWPTRLRIAIGSAKGLAYLHEDCLPKIIHRDIKAANILIDNNFEAMVADFGLAKLTTDNNTHVSTRVMGTFGYLAPEYASSGKLSEKSDVFSFGVMLLELVTGRRPIDLTNPMEDSLVDWARPLLAKAQEDGSYEELVDPRLEGNFIPQELSRMASCAAASIRHSARKRPKMSQIVRALQGESSMEDLNEGVKPGQSAVYGGNSSVYDTRAYNADMMQFKKMVMPTQEFDSSEHDSMEMEKNS